MKKVSTLAAILTLCLSPFSYAGLEGQGGGDPKPQEQPRFWVQDQTNIVQKNPTTGLHEVIGHSDNAILFDSTRCTPAPELGPGQLACNARELPSHQAHEFADYGNRGQLPPSFGMDLGGGSGTNGSGNFVTSDKMISSTTYNPLPSGMGGGGYAPMIGASGVASVVSQGLMVATQGMPKPDYSQFEKRVEAIRQNTQRIRKENEAIQREIDKGNSAEAKRWSQKIKEQINQNQIRLNTPVSTLLSNAANEMIQKKSNAAQAMLSRQLRGYDSVDLEHEISTWKTYSKEKKDTLDQVAQFAAQAERLEKLRTLDRPYEKIVRAAIQSGLDVLNEAAQIAGGRKNGIFRDTLELSQSIYEIGKAVTDFGLSTVPGISTARDIYEAATGYNLVSGEELSTFDRALSLVNIATLGIGKTPLKGIQRIGQWIYNGGEGEHLLKDAVKTTEKILDSAGQGLVKLEQASVKTAHGLQDLVKNPLKNTRYTDKVVGQMKQDIYHGFPKEVDNFAGLGKSSQIAGGDGVVRTKIRLEGGYNKKDGIFEWIVEPDGRVNHRLFVPND